MRKYLLALCSLLGMSLSAAAAGPPSVTPRDGIVLLTNGEIIRGTIIPAGDRFDVHLESGEISLRKADVALVCASVEECYQHKRADIDSGRVQDHLDLAEWCVRNRLFARADQELTDARRADSSHPKIRLVQSRLDLARAPAEIDSASTRPEGAVRPVSAAPLDLAARNLPPGTMETFTNTIQPLLLNNCSKSGCHLARSDGGFRLERVHPRFASRTTTQRNLEQVLTLINRDDPPASALLQTPIHPHATVKMPIFTDRHQGQYRQLVQWVYAVAGTYTPAAPPSLSERTAPLLQNVPGATGSLNQAATLEAELPDLGPTSGLGEAGAPSPELPQDSAAPDTPQDGDSALDPTASERAYTPEQLRALGLDANGQPIDGGPGAPRRGVIRGQSAHVQRGAKPLEGFTPRDEFDPEIFNRRYFDR